NDAGDTVGLRAHALPVSVPDHTAEDQQHADGQRQDQRPARSFVFAYIKSAIIVLERVFTACHVRSAHGRTPWNQSPRLIFRGVSLTSLEEDLSEPWKTAHLPRSGRWYRRGGGTLPGRKYRSSRPCNHTQYGPGGCPLPSPRD